MCMKSLTTTPVTFQQHHRILIYTTCYNVIDGVTLTIRKIEQGILDAGHEVCILTTNSGDPANTNLYVGEHPRRQVMFLDEASVTPFSIQSDPSNPDINYYCGLSLSSEQKERLDQYQPSLIHVTVPDPVCQQLIEYSRSRQIPLMGTYHSNYSDYLEHGHPLLILLKPLLIAYFSHLYYHVQRLYVPTPVMRNHVREQYINGVDNLDIWGRGVDLKKFNPSHRCQAWRNALGFSESDVVIAWVGRLPPEKRPDIFAKVIRRLHKNGVAFKAIVIGDGPCADEMKDLPNTQFLGWMSRSDLAIAYASIDVFLFPSAVETFGNVTLEAAASGVPVVVESACSGHVVRNNVTGFACHLDNVDDYYNATYKLVTDHELRRKFSKAGREFSLNFENKRVVEKMIQNYNEVTEEFDNEFQSNHANRDNEYEQSMRNSRSFTQVISLFLALFVVASVTWLASFLVWCTQLKRTLVHEVEKKKRERTQLLAALDDVSASSKV